MRPLPLFLAVGLLVAACGSAAPTPEPQGFGLRMWLSQALPPAQSFGSDAATVTIADGVLISSGPQVAMYPGPLLPNLVARPISDGGINRILGAARAAGLLGGPTDFGVGAAPGAQRAHIRLTVNGEQRELVGDPSRQIVCIQAPCEGAPGTPEAFAGFWALLSDPVAFLGPELGAERPYAPRSVAVLVGAPLADGGLAQKAATWPLVGPMAEFGVPFGPASRCGIIAGAEIEAALAAFGAANELTRWHDRGQTEYGLVVRLLLPGDPDPCQAVS